MAVGKRLARLSEKSYLPWPSCPGEFASMESALAVEIPQGLPADHATPPLVRIHKTGLTPFNSERARAAALRSHAVRKARKEERERERIAQRDRDLQESPGYVAQRVVQTRAHIEMLDQRLQTTRDPRDIKAIADAIAKLQDTERILSGRPLPGQMKPGKAPVPRPSASALGPVD